MNKRSLKLALTGVVIIAFLTGCSSATDGTTTVDSATAVPAELSDLVTSAMMPIEDWTGPTTGPIAKSGVSVVSIPCAGAAYGCAEIDRGVIAAAEVLGWDVLSIDPKGDPAAASAAIRQAIQINADAIVLGSWNATVLKVPIAEARAAGIIVINAVDVAPLEADGPNHNITIQGEMAGQMLGAYMAVHSEGTAQVGFMNDEEFPNQFLRADGIRKSLALCTGCAIIGESNFAVTEIGTTLTAKSQAFIQANPTMNWLWVAFDAAAADVVIGAGQAGASKVSIGSMDGNPQNIDFIAAGKETASVVENLQWTGWASMDNINRILNGEDPAADDGIPIRLITADNVEEFKKNGIGPIDYKGIYKTLWTTGAAS